MSEIQDLFNTYVHPFNVQLLNETGHNIAILNTNKWVWTDFNFSAILFTIIIVGLTSGWWVNRIRVKHTSELKETRDRADRDIKTIYKKNNELLEETLRQAKQEVDKERANSIKAIQENTKIWEKKIEEEHNISRREIGELVYLCRKLKDSIGKINKEKQARRLEQGHTHGVQVGLPAHIALDITTSSDLLFNEAVEVLKKYDKKV